MFDITRFSMGVRGRSSMHQVCKGEKGSALITVLIVMGVLTVLGAALMHYSMTDNLQVFNDEKRMQAHYLARSGAEAVADYIMKNPENADELLGKETEPVELGKGTFQVEVTKRDNGELLIESTGDVDGFIRTVKLTLEPHSLGDYAVFCNSIIDMGGNAGIEGNVGTNATDANSIKISGNSSIVGNVQVGPGGDEDVVDISGNASIEEGEIGQLDSERKYKAPKFPDEEFEKLTGEISSIDVKNNDYEIIGNGEDQVYSSIDVKNGSLKITVNEDVVQKIIVDSIGVGNIQLKGKGKVKLYVNTFEVGGSVNEGGTPNSLIVYYKGEEITINNNQEFCGTIISDHAVFKINGKGNVIGNIISTRESVDSVMKITGSATIHGVCYAPFSKLKFAGGSEVNGLVVADKVMIKGKFNLNYPKDPDEINFPFDDNEICPGFRKGIWSD